MKCETPQLDQDISGNIDCEFSRSILVSLPEGKNVTEDICTFIEQRHKRVVITKRHAVDFDRHHLLTRVGT